MQTVTLTTQIDHAGLLTLEIPTDLPDREVEIVVVIQPLVSSPVDNMGYPIGYFEETYGSFADEPLERDQPSHLDILD